MIGERVKRARHSQVCSIKNHDIYVIGYGKTAHFAHYFKIELLVFKGSVDLKQ